MNTTLAEVFQIAAKLPENEQQLLANYWLEEIKNANYLENIKDEMKWNKTFSESQDALEILANQAMEEINQGKAEAIDWDEL